MDSGSEVDPFSICQAQETGAMQLFLGGILYMVIIFHKGDKH